MNKRCFCKLIRVLVLAVSAIPAGAADLVAPGVPNFHQVDGHIFRGGQPTNVGWSSLAKLGVKTVIDLRRSDEHSTAAEAQAVKAAGMQYINVPMNGGKAPNEADVRKIFDLFDSNQSVFVHCREGKDRTGTVIACYRIMRDHWQNSKALQEAESYGMHWIEIGMKRYIRNFQPFVEHAEVTDSRSFAVRP